MKAIAYVSIMMIFMAIPTTGCDNNVKPTPAQEPTTTAPTFTEYDLLEDYLGIDPSEVYDTQSLERMRNFTKDNEKLISDYDGRHFHILTEFLGDNPDATAYPIAVDKYVREIDDMIFNYCQRDYDDYVRETINMNWSNFVEAEKKGELINSINGGKMNFLPIAIFWIDMENRHDAGTPRFGGIEKYNENILENRPNLIEVAYKNIQYFQNRHDETWYIATHLDVPIIVGDYDVKELLLNSWLPSMRQLAWSNSIAQAQKDVEALLDNGSPMTILWIQVYSKARFENDSHDEDAVEGGIADLWTIGMPAYRVWAKYPSNTGSYHGELAGPLTQHDIDLLMSLSDEELFMDSETQSMTTLWIRRDKLIEDGTTEAFISLPNGERRYLLD